MENGNQKHLYIERCRMAEAYQKRDMGCLEKSMRRLQELLDIYADDSMNLEYQMTKMQFDMINAALYHSEGMYSEAKMYSDSAAKAGKAGLILIVNGGFLDNPDKEEATLSDAWDCIFVLCSLYQQYLELQDVPGALRAVEEAMRWIGELEPYFIKSSVICERAARYMWQMSTVFNTCGDLDNSIRSIDKAIVLYDTLYRRHRAVYAGAMCLQSKMFRLGFRLAKGQMDEEELKQLERETGALLTGSKENSFEWNSCLVVDAAAKMFRGFAALSAGQYMEALRAFDAAQSEAEAAKDYCGQLSKKEDEWFSTVGKELEQKIIATEITCIQQAAGCEYFLNNHSEAKKLLEKTLKLMQIYADRLPEIDTSRSKIQAYMMLAELNGNQGEYKSADFYFERITVESAELAEKTGLSQDWGTCIHSCSFAMDYQKSCKQTDKAKMYAERGIEACEKMKKIDAGNDALHLQPSFEKMLKKKGLFSKWF